MEVLPAEFDDLEAILELQYLAYQSEARLLNNFDIPPLRQTLDEVRDEFANGLILKAVEEDGRILGSVRTLLTGKTAYIGKLIVHPEHQKKGIGTKLLLAAETFSKAERYELFTSDKSQGNLRLYERLGYRQFLEKDVSPGLRFVYLEKRA